MSTTTKHPRGAMFCASCHSVGKPKTHTKGSTLLELVLWLCFLVPGLIYSIWRHGSRHPVCRFCGHRDLIPPTSPRALQLSTR